MKFFLKKDSIADSWKKYFYFICFFILCICDQRVGSASGEIQLVCPNVVLIVLSGIVLSHYPLSGFRRCSVWIPMIVCTAGAFLVMGLLWPKAYFHYQLISGTIAAILYCCVIIQTILALFSKKRLPYGNHVGLGLLGLMLVLILISRHDRYGGFFLCLSVVLIYLTDFTDQEYEWLSGALGSAVLAAFFVFQGLAFVFRPYDSLRYLGLYANTNMNALFYQMVYCVFLSIFCVLELKEKYSFLKWGSFCFACAMWSFVLLTMCRSAVLGMAAATVSGFGIILWKRQKARLRRSAVCIGGMILGSILSFPIVYGAVRYLPAVFHHPVWFMSEYSEEKVHSWDPCDSEKYTDWREVLQENFGRFFPDIAAADEAPVILLASGEEGALPVGITALAALTPESDLDFEVVSAGEEETAAGDSAAIRLVIYRHYLSHLNLRGHAESENGIWIDADYYAPHAHNIVLQYAFNYGLPAGILLVVYLFISGIRFLYLCVRKEKNVSVLPGFLLFASIAVFGMLEIIWRYGQLSHVLLLLLPCFAWRYGTCESVGADCARSGEQPNFP